MNIRLTYSIYIYLTPILRHSLSSLGNVAADFWEQSHDDSLEVDVEVTFVLVIELYNIYHHFRLCVQESFLVAELWNLMVRI